MKLEVLKSKIILKKWKYREFAEKIGMKYRTFMRVLEGLRELTPEEKAKVYEVLELTPEEFSDMFWRGEIDFRPDGVVMTYEMFNEIVLNGSLASCQLVA